MPTKLARRTLVGTRIMEFALALCVLLAQVPASQESVPPPAAWTPQPSWPWILDVASDDSRVAVARKDGVVELWDPVELEPLEVLEPKLVTIPRAIALSPSFFEIKVS